MKQTKIESMIEVFLNYLSGFILAYFMYKYLIIPYPVISSSPALTVSIFTGLSVLRSFLWRRFFNAELHKAVHAVFIKLKRINYNGGLTWLKLK